MEEVSGVQTQEKNKEKFQYEMTEILFELKGQFARYQGEKIDYSEAEAFAEKLEAKIQKLSAEPVTEISCPDVSVKNIQQVSVEPAEIPEILNSDILIRNIQPLSVKLEKIENSPVSIAVNKLKCNLQKDIGNIKVEEITKISVMRPKTTFKVKPVELPWAGNLK